jgi:hypothetical protein
MRQKTSQSLYAYWNEVRRGRIAPQRLEIQPGHIAEHLPDAFILERCDAHAFRFRLAGTRMCTRFGFELRGLNFLDRWSDGDRAMLEHHLSSVTDTGSVAVFTVEAEYSSGRRASFEILVLPLVHTGQAIDRLLCSMSPLEEPTGAREERIASVRLLAAERIWPDGRPHAIAERQAPLAPEVRKARIVRQDRRQFRVYEGGLGREGREKP